MGPSSPIEAFDDAAFDTHDVWTTSFEDVHVHDPAAAALAEETSLLSPAVAGTIKVRDEFVFRKVEEGKDSGRAKCACRLFAAVETVTVIELDRCCCRRCESNRAAGAGDVHAGSEQRVAPVKCRCVRARQCRSK